MRSPTRRVRGYQGSGTREFPPKISKKWYVTEGELPGTADAFGLRVVAGFEEPRDFFTLYRRFSPGEMTPQALMLRLKTKSDVFAAEFE